MHDDREIIVPRCNVQFVPAKLPELIRVIHTDQRLHVRPDGSIRERLAAAAGPRAAGVQNAARRTQSADLRNSSVEPSDRAILVRVMGYRVFA